MFSATRTALAGAASRPATLVAKRWKSGKSIEVSLRANIQGLGKPGDIVMVAPGRMRNRLYPMRLAAYIDKRVEISRAAIAAEQDALKQVQQVDKAHRQAHKKEQRAIQLMALHKQLQMLPPLVFSRAVNEVLPGSKIIFGSVQAEDVIKELKDKYNIAVDKVTVQGTKIKTIGPSWARVDLGGDVGTVELQIIVERR
ncbi:hypothetical protein B0O80DRAFT_445545 [Mortierella sp. GBAus27b]|nr:hypothetical protein BGX31_007063 [Mortierella sp. GBA43]KAI8357671.1 hypothetical protein B0O80DRAFT_445545 [Mortierella sp. GBAus27b]